MRTRASKTVGELFEQPKAKAVEPLPQHLQDVVAHIEPHPISDVRWVDPATLHANDYNPNRVFSPELALLKTSLLEDGWAQAITIRENGEIVDGFHRWNLGLNDPDVRRVCGSLVPVVTLRKSKTKTDQILTTIRFNRARGQHGILAMAEIVRSLMAEGLTDKEIQVRMGLEREEFARLSHQIRSPDLMGKDSFGKSWVPSLPEGGTREGAHKANLPKEKRAASKSGNGGRGL